ncbi:hypothetical protein BKM03_27285 [Pseudomonas avellanae]|uniref:Uncharacterized protein n=1 Tax=Pseudomonas avellanae TaxID=46257 RepID=A0AAD0M6C2_9PSED|nr:hypothetical protein BKM03_27285 [Pseudomonas avellanae]POP87518.1 hypothetical protein CXB34_06650 [Pseudomonas amygdali pv. morsprunorum]
MQGQHTGVFDYRTDAERPERHYHAECSALYISLLLILAKGRGSGLVRERAGIFSENASTEIPSSRTSPLPQSSIFKESQDFVQNAGAIIS